jgi:predicted aldo/keto reductase-like oxidoreductase
MVSFTATRRMSLVKSRKIPAGEKHPVPGDCYRFVLSNPYVDVVISAPSKARQLKENLSEVAKGQMDPAELEWMRRIGDYVYGRRRYKPNCARMLAQQFRPDRPSKVSRPMQVV